MSAGDDLRAYLARILGWTDDHAVGHALRAINLGVTRGAHLVLSGAGDLVLTAYSLHRRTLGVDRPFIVCDPHRQNTAASPRAPANRTTGAATFAAAAGGVLCVRRW
jgi:hypothetical protein